MGASRAQTLTRSMGEIRKEDQLHEPLLLLFSKISVPLEYLEDTTARTGELKYSGLEKVVDGA